MLDDYFELPEILRRHRAGFFGAYLDEYTSIEKAQGYPRNTVRNHCYVFRIFGRWLDRRGLAIADLDDEVIGEFWRKQRWIPRIESTGTRPLRRLLDHLRGKGLVPAPKAEVPTEAAALAHRYGEYLLHDRALAADSASRQIPIIEHFLRLSFGRGPLRLRSLGEKAITRFVLGTAAGVSPRTHQTQMSALRSFFRFLLEQGEIQLDLSGAVPSVAAWRHAGVPKYLSPDQVEQVLASCDRRTPMGRRDFAMLLMLARLGVRACEVARLDLQDIHWRTGELIIRGKGSSLEALPLLAEVGEALAAYIKRGRPECQTRRVFTRVRAPFTALALKGSVTTVVRTAMSRAGLDVPIRGAHVLRHSLATSMLRDGASMSEIGVLLRHRSPATTEIYAKVDLTSLKRLAQPWPAGGAR